MAPFSGTSPGASFLALMTICGSPSAPSPGSTTRRATPSAPAGTALPSGTVRTSLAGSAGVSSMVLPSLVVQTTFEPAVGAGVWSAIADPATPVMASTATAPSTARRLLNMGAPHWESIERLRD